MSRPLLDPRAVYVTPSGRLCMWLASASTRCRETEVMFRYVERDAKRPEVLTAKWAYSDGFALSAANLSILQVEP